MDEIVVNDDSSVKPDYSNVYNKRQFTFLIEEFLKHCVKSAEVDFNEYNYHSLMEAWEKW